MGGVALDEAPDPEPDPDPEPETVVAEALVALAVMAGPDDGDTHRVVDG